MVSYQKKKKRRKRNSVRSVVALLLICMMPIGLLMIDEVRSDVYIASCEVTDAGKLVLYIYVEDERGYVRKVTTQRQENGLYLDFHSTTGFSNPNGAKTKYTLSISEECSEIYMYRGRNQYEKVLEKVGNKWIHV